MIERVSSVANNLVFVGISFTTELIVVQNKKNESQVKYFAGLDDIKEMFKSFDDSFSENTTYKNAIEFFKPNQSIKLS
jgi:hypothetical protein